MGRWQDWLVANGWLYEASIIISVNGRYFWIFLCSILNCIVFGSNLALFNLKFPRKFQSEEVKVRLQRTFICPQVTRWSIWAGAGQQVPLGTNLSAWKHLRCVDVVGWLIWYQRTISTSVYTCRSEDGEFQDTCRRISVQICHVETFAWMLTLKL